MESMWRLFWRRCIEWDASDAIRWAGSSFFFYIVRALVSRICFFSECLISIAFAYHCKSLPLLLVQCCLSIRTDSIYFHSQPTHFSFENVFASWSTFTCKFPHFHSCLGFLQRPRFPWAPPGSYTFLPLTQAAISCPSPQLPRNRRRLSIQALPPTHRPQVCPWCVSHVWISALFAFLIAGF